MTHEVRLILCGAGGHMGRRALCLIPLLRSVLREHLKIRLTAIVEPQPQARREVRALLNALMVNIEHSTYRKNRTFDDLAVCLQSLQPELGQAPHLVYDSSPTPFHFNHLSTCQAYNVHYLGEKPLVTHRRELEILRELAAEQNREARFFTDFIETHSTPFITATRLCGDLSSPPKLYRFWREGAGGLKKLLDPSARKGVQGGALLDKGVHDLSILHGFLRATRTDLAAFSASVSYSALMLYELEGLLRSDSFPIRVLGPDQALKKAQRTPNHPKCPAISGILAVHQHHQPQQEGTSGEETG